MLEIKNKNHNCEFNFEGIKIFESNNTTKTYKNLFYESEIKIDNKLVKSENIIYINEMTKILDLIDLSKKSIIMQLILENIYDNEILNKNNIETIKNKINDLMEYEILETKESDIVKIVNLVFELINDKFINNEILSIILEKIYTEKKLLIFDNVSWLKIELLEKYINNHDFIILTNNIRNTINSYKYMECYVNENLNELLDVEVLINYVSEKLPNENITIDSFEDFLNNNNFISFQIHEILKKI